MIIVQVHPKSQHNADTGMTMADIVPLGVFSSMASAKGNVQPVSPEGWSDATPGDFNVRAQVARYLPNRDTDPEDPGYDIVALDASSGKVIDV